MTDTARSAALAGDELETWAAFATVLEWLPAALDAQLQRDAKLTHFEYGILYALANAPQMTLRMSVLAAYANSSLSRLSRAATRLEARGWMRRMTDPADGRVTLAVLTERGQDAVAQATPGHARLVHELVLDRLTAPQKRQLQVIARRLTDGQRGVVGWRPEVSPS